MQITKITEEQLMPFPVIRKFTAEELQREYGYYLTQKLLKSMLDKEMVSVDEFDKITALNRKSFPPVFIGDYALNNLLLLAFRANMSLPESEVRG